MRQLSRTATTVHVAPFARHTCGRHQSRPNAPQKRWVPELERRLRDERMLVNLDAQTRLTRHGVAQRGVTLNRGLAHQQLGEDFRIPLLVHVVWIEVVLRSEAHQTATCTTRGGI